MFAAAKVWDAKAIDPLATAAPELVKVTDERGRTPLHVACSTSPTHGHPGDRHGIKSVDVLLSHGADLETTNHIPDGDEIFPATPLWYAVARGENQRLVEHLMKLGARSDWCLWAAVWRDDEQMLRTLLTGKPKLDLVFDGETPLYYAARLQRLRTLDLLLDAGADPQFKSKAGHTVAGIATLRKLPAAIIERMEGRRARPARRK